MTTLTYGEHQFDIEKLLAPILAALAQEGLTHYMGNRVASKVHSWAIKEASEAGEAATKEEIKAWKDSHEDACNEKAKEYRGETAVAINAGTLSVHAPRGPSASADPLTAEMRKIAKQQISNILVASGMKFPGTKDKKPVTIMLKGKAFTGDELIANRLDTAYPNNNREAIEREAKRAIDARKRESAKLAEAGVDSL